MEALGDADPRQVGEYRLLRRLGAGGMGRVYLGRTAGGRTVAVKLVHEQFAADAEFRVRFRNEVAAARQVGGRWTAPVLDADTEGAQPWVATGYVAGPSLGSAVRDFGPLPGAAVRSLGVGLAEALQAVHARGLVHRDVKPSNVLLALDGPRLIDFGITRALDAATALTRSGFVVGSPGYLSPEQAEGRGAGAASDVFSLGAVLAYAATGTAPFGSGLSAAVLLYRVLHEEPDLDIPDPRLHAVVADCLAKDPDRRPTPAQLRERLTAQDRAAAERLDQRDWLPPAIGGALAAMAVDLLDLDGDAPSRPTAPTGQFGPAEPWSAPPPVHRSPTAPHPHPHPQPHPGAPYPGAHPSQPFRQQPHPPQAPPVRPRLRRGTLLLSAVLIAALTGTVVYLAAPDGDHSAAGDPGTTPKPTAIAAPESDGVVPAAFLGTWQGTLGSEQTFLKADFTITLSQGRPNDPVARIHNNSGAGTRYCDAVADLVQATADRVVLRTAPMNSLSGCAADPHDQVYTPNPDGSLHLLVGGFSGDLRKK
ncbi:serine/threonine-protein kinase [Streptomyces sp. NRRL S-350]|uniref:serine/threonine-protein kinase n=1 Tax=Streptomyces sp. NRRL S-350 TaxID=1463902 RepID=UPI00068BEF14|nr:serine/threonine-protein kinase [Streptomyces sp. NRRL S-350]